MTSAILTVLGTSFFTMAELWILKLARLDVFGRLSKAYSASGNTRFFLESLLLVAFVLVQPAILIWALGFVSPDMAKGASDGIRAMLSIGLTAGR